SRHCAVRHDTEVSTADGGWRLPSMDELDGIYDRSSTMTSRCGAYICSVSPLFMLTGPGAWINVSSDSPGDWVFALSNGNRVRSSGGGNERALCVGRCS